MAGKRPELTHKVIVYDAPDTPYYRELFRQGIRALNDLIDESEALKRRRRGGQPGRRHQQAGLGGSKA